uniref:Uncharacterized protein n=1 Tax=Myotis myotis TaxID=51298 RepID=A0A7J7Z5K7_MYOMY|nr:hypothetical protein mMyoMyo1_010803 [Myotis myotis]
MTLTSCSGFLSSWNQKTNFPLKTHLVGHSPRHDNAVLAALPWSSRRLRSVCGRPPAAVLLSSSRSASSSETKTEAAWEGRKVRAVTSSSLSLWTWHGLDPHGEKPPALTRPWRTWSTTRRSQITDHRVAWGRAEFCR